MRPGESKLNRFVLSFRGRPVRSLPRYLLSLLFVCASAGAQNLPIPFTPVDAAYSSSLDRLVMVSAGPNQLHIYNPTSGADTKVDLSAVPLALSVSPDGRFAAAGHNNLISYINLQTATVQETLTVGVNVTALVLAQDYIYILPSMSVRISDGAIANRLAPGVPPIRGQFGPDGAIYAVENQNLTQRTVQGATVGEPRMFAESCFSPALGFVSGRLYNGCGKGHLLSAGAFATRLKTPDFTTYKAWTSHPNRGLAGITSQYAPEDQVSFDDSIVDFFSNGFPPAYIGRLTLPDRWSGDWIFFNNSGDRLYVVNHSGSAYAIYSATLSSPSCAVQLSRTSATSYSWDGAATVGASPIAVPASGGYVAVQVNSTESCLYEITSNSPWIVPRERLSGGVVPLVALIRPNTTSSSRTGTITLGSLTVTITQAAAPPAVSSSPASLGYRTRQATYSKALDRFILTSAFPNELHIYDPVRKTGEFRPLTFVPSSLVLSPDGLTAGIGGEGVAQFFDLRTGSSTPVYETRLDAALLLLPGNGYAHFSAPGLPSIHTGNGGIQAGTETVGAAPEPAAVAPPSYRYVHLAVQERTAIAHWDFNSPGQARLTAAPRTTQGLAHPPFWYSEDGARLYDANGAIYSISDSSAPDLTPAGYLNGFPAGPPSGAILTWLNHAAPLKTIATVSIDLARIGLSLQLFGEDGLTALGRQQMPVAPRYVTWNSTADRLYVLLRFETFFGGDSTYGSAVYTIAAGSGCATPVTPTAAVGAFGGSGQLAVTAACAWKAASSAPWLSITSGGFGIGSSTLGYAVARNDTGAPRSGSISFGDRAFVVTQSAGGTLTLEPTSVTVEAIGGPFRITVKADAAWTAVSRSDWVRLVSGNAGTGQGTVGYIVAPNPSTSARTGTIVIGGFTFTVTQSAAGGAVTLQPAARSVRGGGETFDVRVTATGNWLAVSANEWIKIAAPEGGVGSGPGTLKLIVEPNYLSSNGSDPPRSGLVTVNGQAVLILQVGATFRFTPNVLTLGPAGGSGSTVVETVDPAVVWSALSDANWIRVSGGAAGSGIITYNYDANTTGAVRNAIIYVNEPGNSLGYTIPVTQAPAPAALHFIPVLPCRIADTREPGRGTVFGSPSLTGGSVERSFPVPQSPCGIPATAKAYALNVTAVPKGPLGYITIWPSGQARPFVSTLNSIDGRIKANAAIVAAGADGRISVAATEATDLVLDINGYFVDATANSPAALAFYPLPACRVMDTRDIPGSRLQQGETRGFPIRGTCGVPSFAQAYSLNVTAVPSGPLGYLTMWPAGRARPFTSTLNGPTGTAVANAAIVAAGAGGAVNLFSTGDTHVVLDINGYFAPPGAAGAQRFYPITPCRAVDTRLAGSGPALVGGSARSFSLPSSGCFLPAAATAYALNATVVPQSALSYLTLWPAGQIQPIVSTLNAVDDVVVANAAIVAAGAGGAVTAYVSHGTHLILDVNGYFAP